LHKKDLFNFLIIKKNMKNLKKYISDLRSPLFNIAIGYMLGNIRYYSTDNNSIKKRLSKLERSQFYLTPELKNILIGLFLGDLCAQKRATNTNLHFEQGLIHEDYISHLYDLFKDYCNSGLKHSDRKVDSRTGQIYTRIQFTTYSLPCFNELYYLFYPNKVKVIPQNIGELLTPIGLAYWIADDGFFNKKGKTVVLSTDSYTLDEVNLLLQVLTDKFGLICYKSKHGKGHVIYISSRSLSDLQSLIGHFIPDVMKYKINL
jgi:hypothetical protein